MSGLDHCDVLVLCGGLGTRLRSVLGESQKVMAQVDGRPFLDLHISFLQKQGIKRVILCTGYQAGDVEHYYQDHHYDLEIEFSREQQPLGTGGALKNAVPLIRTDSFFLINGDSFCPFPFQQLLSFHNDKKALVSVVLSEVDNKGDFGTVVLDEEKKITAFKEKETGGGPAYVNAGIYCFDKKISQWMPNQEQFSLENDVFPQLVGHDFYGLATQENFIDIGTPERYTQVQRFYQK